MKIALTGATGFIGRYILKTLIDAGHELRCLVRETSDRTGFSEYESHLEWVEGLLNDQAAASSLIQGTDAIVHSALHHPGGGFRGGEGTFLSFVETNVLGSLRLIETAKQQQIPRFIFLSSCAVHDEILQDRPLDETHPLWAKSHYGAHKGAIEKFVHSFGLGQNYPVCAIRPTGVYGEMHQIENSKWFPLIQQIVQGDDVTCSRGGKEVHASDVAKAVKLLLEVDDKQMIGEAFNCYDRYISEWDVAHLAKEISGSESNIQGSQTRPQNEIETKKIRELGMTFGGDDLLKSTIENLMKGIQKS